jgi:holin-like protein
MLKEIVLIFGCLILGNIVRYLTGLSVPGSVFGMIILLIFLKTGILNELQIKRFSNFLLENMGFFFVPVGVGIALYIDLIKAEIFPILGASLISTLIILLVVGLISGGRK